MKKLFAIRPCSFGGQKFFVGDEIPEHLVNNAEAQKQYGLISIVEDNSKSDEPTVSGMVSIPIVVDGSASTLDITTDQIAEAVKILQMDAKPAAEFIGGELDVTVLVFVRNVDSRKTVREAADKQLAILTNLEGDTTAPTQVESHSEASENGSSGK